MELVAAFLRWETATWIVRVRETSDGKRDCQLFPTIEANFLPARAVHLIKYRETRFLPPWDLCGSIRRSSLSSVHPMRRDSGDKNINTIVVRVTVDDSTWKSPLSFSLSNSWKPVGRWLSENTISMEVSIDIFAVQSNYKLSNSRYSTHECWYFDTHFSDFCISFEERIRFEGYNFSTIVSHLLIDDLSTKQRVLNIFSMT